MLSAPLKLLATAGAAVAGGIFGISVISTLSVKVVQSVIDSKRRAVAPPCSICNGQGFIPCKLCNGQATIEWSPVFDPVFIKPCVCPTCEGNRVQRCLNCIGRGFV